MKFVSKVWLTVLCRLDFIFAFSLFLFHFLEIYPLLYIIVWMDKIMSWIIHFLFSNWDNQVIFATVPKFQFLAVINNSFSEWSDYGIFLYVLKKTKKFPEKKLDQYIVSQFRSQKDNQLLLSNILNTG
jgi:hypothetical protein